MLAHRGRFALDWTGAWRLDAPPAPLDEGWPVKVEVAFADPVLLRPERLIAHGLGLSRNEVRHRVKCDLPPHSPASAGFTFTVLAAD